MAQKYQLLIWFFLFFLWGSDCPGGFVELDDNCYFKRHLDVLQDFIDTNKGLKETNPIKIGYQEWTNNRLTYLYLGDLNITHLPDSIGVLKDLNSLDLRKNKLLSLPEGLCNIYPHYTRLNLTDNQICPPYPFCFDYLSQQNTKGCDSFRCPAGYNEIQGECYNEIHIQILQSIIDINSALNGITPLELGKDIGYQQWENGNLTHLNLISNQLTMLPEDLCNIYSDLESFDVSNNYICPPYPACFEYLGYQNTKNCTFSEHEESADNSNITDNRDIISSVADIVGISSVNFQYDLDILQSFINNNESLVGKNPLEIGKQKWSNLRLSSLDLSALRLTYIPANLCSIFPNLTNFDISNNFICPPYPQCIEYISMQNTESCGDSFCPDNYIEIEAECYFEGHLKIIQDIIDSNASLTGSSPLDIGNADGIKKWTGGKLNQLILVGNKLTNMPESICDIYSDLQEFEMTNNFICPPYPSCISSVGYQNIDDCAHSLSCPDGYVIFDEKCYYYDDLQVLIDFTTINDDIRTRHPLLLGYQVWKDSRLQQLYLDGLNIISVPESIDNLDHLEYLSLNNNKLEALPENLCNIYSNLKNLEITNNLLCPPYLQCFDFIGYQNTGDCEKSFCPYGYLDIEGECYFEKDVSILNDFISQNNSLDGRQPLEIGIQKWKNMRLNYLYLGVNQLTAIPESVCRILPELKTFNISQNNICPPYPSCVEDYLGEQNAAGCP